MCISTLSSLYFQSCGCNTRNSWKSHQVQCSFCVMKDPNVINKTRCVGFEFLSEWLASQKKWYPSLSFYGGQPQRSAQYQRVRMFIVMVAVVYPLKNKPLLANIFKNLAGALGTPPWTLLSRGQDCSAIREVAKAARCTLGRATISLKHSNGSNRF